MLNYLSCDSNKYPSSLALCAFSILIWGLLTLIVCLTSAIDADKSPKSSNNDNPRIKKIKKKKIRRGLLKTNIIIILF